MNGNALPSLQRHHLAGKALAEAGFEALGRERRHKARGPGCAAAARDPAKEEQGVVYVSPLKVLFNDIRLNFFAGIDAGALLIEASKAE